MVSFPPLAPSAGWFARFLRAYKTTGLLEESILEANSRLASPREFGRYVIADNHDRPQTLSLAVEGGGRQLRSLNKLDGIQLSEHGDWRRTHLGALEANLGKMPFFRHFEMQLKQIYQNKEFLKLESFNFAIFHMIMSFLMGNIGHEDLIRFDRNRILAERGRELQSKINPEISVIQPMAIYGRETVIGILA